jgi:hypothetical protein
MRPVTAISALVVLPLLLPLLSTGCLPAPKQNYAIEQIPQIDSLAEIMRVQAQAMDPLFKKSGQPSFTPEEFSQMATAARKLQATSVTMKDKFSAGHKASFPTYAQELNQHAGDLLAAADAADAARAAAALSATRATCRGCHHENR